MAQASRQATLFVTASQVVLIGQENETKGKPSRMR